MNRTYIDELPFLEDVLSSEQQMINGGGLGMIPSAESGKIKRFIRNNEYNLPPEAGMNTAKQQLIEEQELLKQQQLYEEQQLLQLQDQEFQQQYNHHNSSSSSYEDKKKSKKKHRSSRIYNEDCDLNCISVADHAANCIVCSKLYNNDKSLYLAIIGVLIIICIILMKKVVEK